MANIEMSSPFRGNFLEAAAAGHFQPQSPTQDLSPQSTTTPTRDRGRPNTTRHQDSPASSPWILTAFSDFSDADFTSESPSTLRSTAPQQTPVLPPPPPPPQLQFISLSTIASNFAQGVSDSILYPTSVSLPSLSNASDRLPRFHPRGPVRPPSDGNVNDADDPGPREPSETSMSVRDSLRIDRFVSNHPKSPPPRSSHPSWRTTTGGSSSSSSGNNPLHPVETRAHPTIKSEAASTTTTTEFPSIPINTMPATRPSRRPRAASASTSNSSPPSASVPAKSRVTRRPQVGASAGTSRPPLGTEDDEDEDEWEQPLAKRRRLGQTTADIIDLVDTETAPAPPIIQKPKSANQIRLASLQCSICMDDMTCLTSTHCGHLFCGGCLHSALHVNATKRVCPICRQKIDLVPTTGPRANKPTSKGFWPLSLKIMTGTRKGKTKDAGV